jgi:hypothetical protein
VIAASDDEHEGMIRMRVHEGEVPEGDGAHRVIIRRGPGGETPEKMATDMAADAVIHRKVEMTESTDNAGGTRRKVKYVDDQNREGSLEIEVKK